VYQNINDSRLNRRYENLETASGIHRLIGQFKYNGKLFFLDPEWRNILKKNISELR